MENLDEREKSGGTGHHSFASVASSTEVQVRGSVGTLGFSEEKIAMNYKVQQRPWPQVFRVKVFVSVAAEYETPQNTLNQDLQLRRNARQ